MLHFPRWQTITIIGICLLSLLIPVPSFLSQKTFEQLPSWAQIRFSLGLDLRGGAHLLAAMDLEELRRDWLASVVEDARKALREAKPEPIGNRITVQGGAVQVRLTQAGTQEAAMKALRTIVQTASNVLTGTQAPELELRSIGTDGIQVTPTEAAINERASQAIGTAIEVIRKRLDPDGTKEVAVQRQGRDRILVQQPGVETEKELEEIRLRLRQAAKMTFHLVHRSLTAEEARRNGIPPGYRIVPSQEETGAAELIQERPLLTGEQLSRASPAFDSLNNQPIVSFTFKPSAAKIFGDITIKNKGYRFAVVLDNVVITAPVIQSEILGGTGQISGRFTVEDTTRVATLLTSGALPAKLTIAEERVVGASLGQDSIDSGKIAAIAGMLAVAIYMIAGYGVFGAFAIVGASFHVIMILALMTLLGSTMTLPGIAGVVLTIGMAVDANVLIYERTREELRGGKTPIAALDAGFRLAYATIIDSQMTSFIAGVLMFALGSGPIRGFAVTFTLGVVTTVFSAVTITRLLAIWWLKSYGRKAIPAPL
jgi:protein-export membrane protein SecD